MKYVYITVFSIVCIFSFWISPVCAIEDNDNLDKSQVISFFSPSGMNGFIVYDTDAGRDNGGLNYESQSFNLVSPLGLPVTVEVEGVSIHDGPFEFQKILENSGSGYLEIFSIQHALTYGSQSKLSPLKNTGSADITMIVASANYQATDRLSAKFSTGISQTEKEKSGTTISTLGYGLDLSAKYKIAPGLSFSVGAGYATNLDDFKDFTLQEEEKRSWSLISKLRLIF